MPSTNDWDSVLLTDGEGAVYRVPLTDLSKYQLPPAEAEEMLEGDVVGFGATPMTLNFSIIGMGSAQLGTGILDDPHQTDLSIPASARRRTTTRRTG